MSTPSEPVHSFVPSAAAPMPHEDKRRSGRAELTTDVSLFSESHFFAGLTEDVSEGGVFVATHERRPIGSEIDLTFTLPTGWKIETRGIVRWMREVNEDTSAGISPGIGVQFVALGEADHAAIRKFLKHRPPLVWDDEPL